MNKRKKQATDNVDDQGITSEIYKECLPNSFCEANTTLIPNPDEDITRKL